MKRKELVKDIQEMIILVDDIETKSEALHNRLNVLLNEACVMGDAI